MKAAGEENLNTACMSDDSYEKFFPHRIKFLNSAIKSGKASLKVQNSLEAAINNLISTFEADGGLLYLFNTQTESLELVSINRINPKEIITSQNALDGSVCSLVFKDQVSVLSNDINRDPRLERTSEPEFTFGTYKLIAAPLILKSECLGVVEIINKPNSHDFSSKEVELLSTLAKNIAVLVQSEQLFDRCCQRLYQRNTMLDIVREVNTSRELPDLLNYIVITAAELLNSEASSLLLREEDELRFEIAFGEQGTEIKKFKVPLGTGIAGSVALSGQSAIVNQADIEESGIFKKIDRESGFTTRNLLCSPLRINGRIIGVVEVLNRRDKEGFDEDDLSLLEGFANEAARAIERTQLIEKRIEAERLATIGRTVAGLAHCIKNITNALKAGEYVVDKGLRDNNTETLKKGWEITKQGSERIRDLVVDMLTISKKREPEFSICCPQELVLEVVDMMGEKVKEKNIKIETQFEKTITKARIDRNNIYRCLLNLVSNALDACEEDKGVIKIETFKMQEKPFFGFRVIDNGHGISEENQKKLFHDFFSTKGSQGTGLGLSVTQAIISEHGGRISCDSELGKGTTFTIELPIEH